MLVGKANSSVLHPPGYWSGNDTDEQLRLAITIFEIPHSGCRGVWLFDNSTGHGKMPEDALLAQNMNTNPGSKYVSKQRETTWFDSRRQPHL